MLTVYPIRGSTHLSFHSQKWAKRNFVHIRAFLGKQVMRRKEVINRGILFWFNTPNCRSREIVTNLWQAIFGCRLRVSCYVWLKDSEKLYQRTGKIKLRKPHIFNKITNCNFNTLLKFIFPLTFLHQLKSLVFAFLLGLLRYTTDTFIHSVPGKQQKGSPVKNFVIFFDKLNQ